MGSALSSPQVSFVACCVLVAAYALSFGPVTWLVTAEMFPPGIRGKALGIGQVKNVHGAVYKKILVDDGRAVSRGKGFQARRRVLYAG